MVPHVSSGKVTRHRDRTVCGCEKLLLKEHGAVREKHRKSQGSGHPFKAIRVLSGNNRLIKRQRCFCLFGNVVRPRLLDQSRQRLIGNRCKLLC